jgi:phosphatidylserine decarboxylase
MVRDAYRFAIPVVVLGIVFVILHLSYIAVLFFILAGFICYFFRNPDRLVPDGANLVVSPADGKVVKISRRGDGEQTISIFLNIFNVHVNRSPIAGERFT